MLFGLFSMTWLLIWVDDLNWSVTWPEMSELIRCWVIKLLYNSYFDYISLIGFLTWLELCGLCGMTFDLWYGPITWIDRIKYWISVDNGTGQIMHNWTCRKLTLSYFERESLHNLKGCGWNMALRSPLTSGFLGYPP
jgi:hypothetical protein